MTDITEGEIWKRREALESAGATLLGKLLFEFSRVDVNLGLCLVWLDGGSRIESLTKQVSDCGFSKRLDYLEAAVTHTFHAAHAGQIEYADWIARARVVRQTRNELVHGRWGVNGSGDRLLNVLGLPTSPEQREVEYGLRDLEETIQEMKDLQRILSKLRTRWPL